MRAGHLLQRGVRGIGVPRYGAIRCSHRVDSCHLCRDHPSGSRAAWWRAIRGRRGPLWWWRRRVCGPAPSSPSHRSTSFLRTELCASFFHATFLGTSHFAAHSCAPCITASRSGAAHGSQGDYPDSSCAAVFRSTGAPAPVTLHPRPNGLDAVARSSAANPEANESSR
jgi:hypothetical protein